MHYVCVCTVCVCVEKREGCVSRCSAKCREAPAATERSHYCNQALLAPVTLFLSISFMLQSYLTLLERALSKIPSLNKISRAADFCT